VSYFMPEKRKYVVGFLFDPTLSLVVLIRKLRPGFQAGLLNGVGGKVELGETGYQAINREFFEEAGIPDLPWKHYLTLNTPNSHLEFFSAIGNVHNVTTILDEEVAVYEVLDVMDRCDTMPNIRWCIQMARSLYFGERASGFEVTENALSDQHHDHDQMSFDFEANAVVKP